MRKMVLFMAVLAMLSGCTAQRETAGEGKTAQEGTEPSLTEAPPFILTEEASDEEALKIGPASYSWDHEEGGQMESVVACGLSPQDAAEMGLISTLKIPKDAQRYSFSTQIQPDTLRIHQWNGSDTDREEDVSIYHDEMPLLELQAGKLYSFELEWKEEDFEKNKFYGTADYFLETK